MLLIGIVNVVLGFLLWPDPPDDAPLPDARPGAETSAPAAGPVPAPSDRD
jgi:hypothetical protein